jgi:PAS domain S-box-containing protein
MLLDPDLTIRSINRTLALTRDQVVGRSVLDFVPSAAREHARGALLEVIASGKATEYGSDYTAPDGNVLRFSTSVQPISTDGEVTALVCSARDITERWEAEAELQRHREHLEELVETRTAELRALNERLRREVAAHGRAQAALAESEARYRGYLSQAPDGIFLADESGRYIDVNEAACQLTGFSREELLALSIHQLAAPSPRHDGLEAFEGLKKEGHTRAEVMLRRRGGGQVAVALDAVKISDDRYMAFCKDITELKQVEQTLRDLTARLEAVREEERSAVAREIHDELGQALTSVKMDLSWLLGRLRKDQAALKERASAANSLVERSLNTVRQISTRLRPAVLDDLGLEAAIEWLATDFSRRTGICCQTEFGGEELAVDPERATAVFRIVQEALTNVTRHADAQCVTVRLSQQPDQLGLEVSDDGVGISEEQLVGPRSLGLIGMRERAAALGGSLAIHARPEGGTTVTLQMAASAADEDR